MNKKTTVLISLCLFVPAYAASPVIPSNFHGFWATEGACRQMNKDGMDAPSVGVSYSKIDLPFNSCELKSVKQSSAQSLSGVYSCRGEEGEVSKQLIEISLNDASKLSVKNVSDLNNLSICKLRKTK